MKKINFDESRSKTKSVTRVPFVVTYHPRLKALGKIIYENLDFLCINDEVKDVFTTGPMVSFRTARKLRNYLIRAKPYSLEKTVGSTKCSNKRCELCENVQINHGLTCDDKGLFYLFTRKTCSKQYTRESADQFRFRWNNYKSNDKKIKRGEHLYEHYYSDGHDGFFQGVTITIIDKTDGKDPKNRKRY